MGFERSVVAYRSKKTKRTSSRTRLSSFMAESETGRSDDFLASTAATSERERGETDDNRAARKLDRGEEQRRAQGEPCRTPTNSTGTTRYAAVRAPGSARLIPPSTGGR